MSETSSGVWSITVDGDTALTVSDISVTKGGNNKLTVRCSVNGIMSSSTVLLMGNSVHLFTVDGKHSLDLPTPNYLKSASGTGAINDPVAPMPGVIEKVVAEPGATVTKGQPLVVMIAMKMEYVIRAAHDGIVEKVFYKPGDTVAKGAILVHLKEE